MRLSLFGTLVVGLLLGCSSSSPQPNAAAEQSSANTPLEAPDPAPEVEPEAERQTSGATASPTLAVRFELDRSTIPSAPTSNNADARVEGRLFVRNTGTAAASVTFTTPAAFELTWTLTDAAGTVFDPMFLSPALPGPGGRPQTSIRLAAGEESAFANMHGISGFFERGQTAASGGPLPPGTYAVSITGIQFGDSGPLTTPDVPLTVR